MKAILKKILRRFLTLIYKIEVKGLDNYHNAGERILIIANHTSFLDPLLLGVFLPDNITFAINTHISNNRWIKPFLALSDVFVMDPTKPLSLKSLISLLKTENKAVIFPEGRITVTGSLMKIYDGPGMVAAKSQAAILPIRIEGTEYTHFSKLGNILRLRLFPKITISIQAHSYIATPAELKGKESRKYSGAILANLMTEMMFKSSHYEQTIFSALLQARNIHGGKKVVAEDLEHKSITYNKLITYTVIFGKQLEKITTVGENVGVLLANSTKTLPIILGLQLHGRVPAMLNYAVGATGMTWACHTGKIKTVLTSRRFINRAKLDDEAEQLSATVNLVYLEDIAQKISVIDKLKGVIDSKTAQYWYKHDQFNAHSPAVLLFTSGSESTPKGVALSHTNILANHKQFSARVSINAHDVVLNSLPMFHSFGFTVGTLLPVLNGMKTFLYPSPLHYSVIPEISYEINATILFGTNTFLSAYGKAAHGYDFYSIRYVFAGAEKLQQSTRDTWSDKFGIRIFEGYGATETSPVLSVNNPLDYKAGSVGRMMPGIDYQLENIPGIQEGGQLHVSGPNIMLGYILADNPGVLVPPKSVFGDGWYDTGDIVNIDKQGFITICGRSKRFAKIAGEMVSLSVSEQVANRAWPEAQHAVVSLPDEKKGEQLILVTTQTEASCKILLTHANGIGAINLPKKILVLKEIPLMGTGKIDYPAVTELVQHLA